MNNYAWTTANVHTADHQRAAQQLRDWELTTTTTRKTEAAAPLARMRTMCAVLLGVLHGGPRPTGARRAIRTAAVR